MPDSAATRSAGRLHPRNWARSLKQPFLVLPFVVALLSASAVIHGTPWAASATKPQCNNRIDDDGDGKIDYPTDPGCTGKGDKSEADPVEPPPPPPPPAPPPPPPQVELEPVDGGPNYYAQFTNPLPSDKFPIGVWLDCISDQSRANVLKNAGVNVLVAMCGPSLTELGYANTAGLKVILQDEWWPVSSGANANPATVSWMGPDETDMQGGTPATLAQHKADSPLGGRFYYENFGKGVAFWASDATAAAFVAVPEVLSIDVYWFADTNVCGTSEGGGKPGVITSNACHVAANYGWHVNRVRTLANKQKPMWGFVELGCPFSGAGNPCITLAQIRAAVWHSLIAGARGIEYFNHSFKSGAAGGQCGATPSLIRDCAPLRTYITSLNAEIQSLRAALEGPKLTSGFTASGGVRAVAKWDGSKLYVFAGAVPGAASETFSIPCVGNATATVVGESRSVPVVAGAFTDSFANANSVHTYRIDGGSTCGLT
jgi:hypothetical protein